MSLQSRVIKTIPIRWKDLRFFQSDTFKDFDPQAEIKLKNSFLENNFTQPFYVWQAPSGELFCLDGKHRTLILHKLISEGITIPEELPATFIDCENKKEASKLVLIYSSLYARVNNQGMFDFIKEYDLAWSEIKETIDLPDFSVDRFEQKYIFGPEEIVDPEVIIPKDDQILITPGDIIQLGNHTVICGSFKALCQILGEKKGRILLTDPPYNLSVDDFRNSGQVQHEDFAMGKGEMTDKEFVSFLSSIMQYAREYTIDGAIHYIFMDWRHVWHMTEAAFGIYGSYEPKQLVVWNKDVMANGSFYRSKHELCFIFKSGEDKHCSHIDLPDRIRTNVWDYPAPNSMRNPDRKELHNHPTPKTVAMIADAILDSTNEKEIVVDFFLGSGTTVIASEHTGRYCYASEIEPKFVQSTVYRYLSYCKTKNISPIFKHLNGNLTLKDFEDGER